VLIIPLTGKLNKKNLPLATIIIILINCAIFFTLQSNDNNLYQKAHQYYFTSGLAEIEVTQYIKYKESGSIKQIDIDHEEQEEKPDIKKINKYYEKMDRDDAFQSQLLDNKIITPQDPQYEQWKALRTEYTKILNQISSVKYGFTPAKNDLFTIFSHMFLHGSLMHLIGNMVFLWLVGCVLELGFGRLSYIIIYLLGGVFAVESFYYFNMASNTPLIGASGAISGLMGAYAVAYGRTKINVFYLLGFYFNYTRVYAILLLPLWLANELFQLFYLTDSNVAYLAHIGGLVGGAFLGFINVRVFRKADHEIFEEDPKNNIVPLMEKALQKIEALDMKEAKVLLNEVLAIDGNHKEAIKNLYNIEKLQPSTEEFQKIAIKRMFLLSKEANSEKELMDAYKDYYRLAEKQRIPAGMLLHLCRVFVRAGIFSEAENIIENVLSNAPNNPLLPQVLLEIAKINAQNGRNENSIRLLRILRDSYPKTPEAEIAAKMII
jgi:membrane associated rhomboid family serine protease